MSGVGQQRQTKPGAGMSARPQKAAVSRGQRTGAPGQEPTSRTYRTEAFGAAQVIRRLNSTRRLTIGIAAHRRVAAGRSRTPRRRPRRGTDRKRQLALSRFGFATIVAPLDAEGAPPKSLSLIAPSGGQARSRGCPLFGAALLSILLINQRRRRFSPAPEGEACKEQRMEKGERP
jgi:hypothetical protein